jgi:hypothetical protein
MPHILFRLAACGASLWLEVIESTNHPATRIVVPVTKSEVREARYKAVPAISSDCPHRPTGVRERISSFSGIVFTGAVMSKEREELMWVVRGAHSWVPPTKETYIFGRYHTRIGS